MKKMMVVLLLILPFALIYFISFTGRVLSIYNHINVENIVVFDNNINVKDNQYIIMEKGEIKKIQIKVLPELASNKEYSISNSDKSVCEIVDDKIRAIDCGTSTIIISSKDRHFVQFVFNVKVAKLDVEDIVTNKDRVELSIGKSEFIDVTIIPSTVNEENKYVEWESLDNSIAVVKNGNITAIKEGVTKVIVRSKHKPSVFKEIEVIVTNAFGKGVYFDYVNPDKIFDIHTKVFDLKYITVINLDNIDYSHLTYSLEMLSDAINIDKLNQGVIEFNTPRVPVVISVSVEIDETLYKDTITLRYIP